MFKLTKPERAILLLVGLLTAIAIFGPHITQYDSYHDFADQTHLSLLPHASDVLSNLPFLLVGIYGLWTLKHTHNTQNTSNIKNTTNTTCAQDMLKLFFYGMILTCFCSSYYHLDPNNASVFLDRMGMTIAFAGIIGLSLTLGISQRFGRAASYLILFLGPFTLWVWQQTDNLLAWSMLQAGGMLIIVGIALFSGVTKTLRHALLLAIAWYALSKVCELSDRAIYEWTWHIVSGHSLKHIFAACAGLPIITCLKKSNCTDHKDPAAHR